MSYPAMFAFFADPERTPGRIAVYLAIQDGERPMLGFEVPRPIKVDAVAAAARVSYRTAIDAIHWMLARGYINDRGRDSRGVRQVTLAHRIGAAA